MMFHRLRQKFQSSPLPLLKRAHRLAMGGDYEGAASAFHKLARKAEIHSPELAPFLYAEAGRACLANNQEQKALAHFRSAITLLGTQQRFTRLSQLGGRIQAELRERGLQSQADEIETVTKNNLRPIPLKNVEPPQKRPTLPAHCPSCGAVVNPNEIDWLDDTTAKCDYCGSPLRADI